MNNKTSDKNVANIEDDVRILFNLKCYLESLLASGQDKIYYNDLLYDEKTIDCINAIEHLLSDYTRQKQINEEHQKENGLLREKVKELDTKNDELLKDLYSANCIISDLTDSIPKQVVIDVLQNNRNELFSMTYLSKEQYRPYEMQVERINKIEQKLLEGEK